MAKQSDYERINRLIITPIFTTWGAKVPEGMAEAYVEDLAEFSDDVLKGALVEVRRTSKTAPRIAHFVEACRSLRGTSEKNFGDIGAFMAGLRKQGDEARRMAREFVEQFSLSPLAHQARAEGWEKQVTDYAYEAAWLQAQIITGIRNPGFSQNALTNWRNEDTERRCQDFVTTCKRQAATGTIEVSPPPYLIEEWRKRTA